MLSHHFLVRNACAAGDALFGTSADDGSSVLSRYCCQLERFHVIVQREINAVLRAGGFLRSGLEQPIHSVKLRIVVIGVNIHSGSICLENYL